MMTNKKSYTMKAIICLLALAFGFASADTCNYIMYTAVSSGVYYPTDTCVGSGDLFSNSSYIYKCMKTTAGAYYVNYITYTDYACTTGSNSQNITSSNTNYEFLCSADDCIVKYEEKYYSSSTTCGGSVDTFSEYPYVAGVCYNTSGSTSTVYGCTEDSYTIFYYSDASCSTLITKDETKVKCEDLDGSSSQYTSIKACSKSGYYGVASSQISAFSTFVSFVMIAIAFFVC